MSLWLLPMLAEVAVTAAVFGVLFQMPPLLALAGGFALSGTAIEVVAAAMTRLGRKGYGLTLGKPYILCRHSPVFVSYYMYGLCISAHLCMQA